MTLRSLLLVVAAACCVPLGAHAQAGGTLRVRESRPGEPLVAHRTGEFVVVLPRRSRESAAPRWSERFQFGGNLDGWDYDLAAESFSIYVPSDYDQDGEPFGVIVWVSPFDDGSIPEGLKAVFDERHLIWIAPNNAGNDRHLFPRSGLALDAAENIERAYHVDSDRIFVSGLSGGGRMAAMLAVDYPDVFSGALPIIGVTTYLEIRLESTPGLFVTRFPEPSRDLLRRAKRNPFVIMTGSGDFNREECRLTAEAYAREGFEHLHFIDVDGMGHEMPPPERFASGLDLLLANAD